MSILPDRNLFIVTSSIKPKIGFFSHEQRYLQTVDTLKNLREKLPESLIILSDVSLNPLTEKEKKNLFQYCNLHIDCYEMPAVREFSENGMKSHAENAMLYNVLMALKYDPRLQKVVNMTKRIFKYSARSTLNENFNIQEYDELFGKYVFKKRIPTWMQNPVEGGTDLLITRLFSFCPSLMDSYLEVISKNMVVLDRVDTEHAHFINIPKKYLVEFDTLGCVGLLAGNGTTEVY